MIGSTKIFILQKGFFNLLRKTTNRIKGKSMILIKIIISSIIKLHSRILKYITYYIQYNS